MTHAGIVLQDIALTVFHGTAHERIVVHRVEIVGKHMDLQRIAQVDSTARFFHEERTAVVIEYADP